MLFLVFGFPLNKPSRRNPVRNLRKQPPPPRGGGGEVVEHPASDWKVLTWMVVGRTQSFLQGILCHNPEFTNTYSHGVRYLRRSIQTPLFQKGPGQYYCKKTNKTKNQLVVQCKLQREYLWFDRLLRLLCKCLLYCEVLASKKLWKHSTTARVLNLPNIHNSIETRDMFSNS